MTADGMPLWRQREYMLLWSGQVVTTLGAQAVWRLRSSFAPAPVASRRSLRAEVAEGLRCIGLSVAVKAITLPAIGLCHGPLELGLVHALSCLFGPLYDVVQFSYRIALIPDALQGRVNSGSRLFAFGLNPAGAALGGWLLERGGSVAALLVFGVVSAALAAVVRLDPAIWQARRLGTGPPRAP